MKRVVVVILDGMRRDLLTEEGTPCLAAFRGRAEHFAAHRSVFPSATRVAAASFATGCYPARHELQGNSVALLEGGAFVRHDAGAPDFLQHKRLITGTALAVPTLAERVKERGGAITFSNASPGAAYAHDPDGHGFLYNRAGSFAPGRTPVPPSDEPRATPDLAGDQGWGGLLVIAWALLTSVLPVLIILTLALLRAETAGLRWSNLTVSHFAEMLQPGQRGFRALTTSVELALAASVLSLALASGVALAQRSGRRSDQALDLITTLLNALPGIVLAVALVLVWNAPWNPVPLYGHRGILLLAYTTVLLPLALRYAKVAATRVSPGFVVAARVHGLPGAVVLGRIVLPLMLPALLGGGVIAFAFGIREFVASVLLQPPGVDTVSTFIFSEAQQGNRGAAMAMSVVSLAVSFAAVAVLRLMQGRPTARGTALLRPDAMRA